MGHVKKYLLVTLGFALAGAIGAAFGTGTAQAVVASLVQSANTTSNPAPTLNVTDPGRIAYQNTVDLTGACNLTTQCTFSFPTVPTGHRLVVQRILGWTRVSSSSTSFVAATSPTYAVIQLNSFGIFNLFASPSPIPGNIGINEALQLYVDASSAAQVQFHTTGTGVFWGEFTLTLTGYELDCTVAACAPIATQ